MEMHEKLTNILEKAVKTYNKVPSYRLEEKISNWIEKCVISFILGAVILFFLGLLTQNNFPSLYPLFYYFYLAFTIIFPILFFLLSIFSLVLGIYYNLKDKRYKITKIKISKAFNLSKSLRYFTAKDLEKAKIVLEGEITLKKFLNSSFIGLLSLPLIGLLQEKVFLIEHLSFNKFFNITNKEYFILLSLILLIMFIISLLINLSRIRKFNYFIMLINIELKDRE